MIRSIISVSPSGKMEEQVRKVISLPALYTTAPWGFSSEHISLSTAACVETLLPLLSALYFTQETEREMERTHESAGRMYSDRVIDIDLLSYGDQIPNTPELKLLHLLMYERRSVLKPLVEIVPGLIHPILKKKMLELLWKE